MLLIYIKILILDDEDSLEIYCWQNNNNNNFKLN